MPQVNHSLVGVYVIQRPSEKKPSGLGNMSNDDPHWPPNEVLDRDLAAQLAGIDKEKEKETGQEFYTVVLEKDSKEGIVGDKDTKDKESQPLNNSEPKPTQAWCERCRVNWTQQSSYGSHHGTLRCTTGGCPGWHNPRETRHHHDNCVHAKVWTCCRQPEVNPSPKVCVQARNVQG